MYMLASLSVDEILLPRHVNRSTNFTGLQFNEEMAQSLSKQVNSVLFDIETKYSCYQFQAMQQTFSLSQCISKKR